jgi:hypothetical protein
MQSEELNNVRVQTQKVIDLVNKKKKQRDHKFLDTLLGRLKELLKSTIESSDTTGLGGNSRLKGALRAYFDTDITESYDEPLVIELDKLEIMLHQIPNSK